MHNARMLLRNWLHSMERLGKQKNGHLFIYFHHKGWELFAFPLP